MEKEIKFGGCVQGVGEKGMREPVTDRFISKPFLHFPMVYDLQSGYEFFGCP